MIGDADPELLFRHYSDELWPPAEALVQYMDVYAKKRALRVRFNSWVNRTSKTDTGKFLIETKQGKTYCAKYLFFGTGLAKATELPKQASGFETVLGGDLDTYHNASTNKRDYEGKRVAIIGRGNSAP